MESKTTSFRHNAKIFVFLCIALNSSNSTEVENSKFKKLSSANNEFAANLQNSLATFTPNNIIFSPTSLFIALGMLFDGAQGKTKQEIRSVLGFDKFGLCDEKVDTLFSQLVRDVLDFSKDNTLRTANAILVDKRLELVPKYKRDMQNLYKAIVQEVDFSTERMQAVRWINQWVNATTNGKISKIVNDLGADTVMAVLNAIYFKGSWSAPFDTRKTKLDKFYNHGSASQVKMVPMMNMNARMPYSTIPGWKAVELPYVGDHFSMVILLPDEQNGLEAPESNSVLKEINAMRRKMMYTRVNLSLPKFRIQSSINLKRPLESLGLQDVFRNANFSGMVQKTQVRVSKVVHKAFVEVTEEGTQAAGASGFFIVPMRADIPRIFNADHPFLFTIMDKRNDLILFVGRVAAL